MRLFAQVSPTIPDLTHPQELLRFGQQMLQLSQWLVLVVAGLGIVMAIVNFSYRHDRPAWLETEFANYGKLLHGIRNILLVVAILIGGFFLCATLANRYHYWEQSKIDKVAAKVAGERVEQIAPQVRYRIEEPYTITANINGKLTELKKTRKLDRFLSPKTSQVDVKLTQSNDPATNGWIYQSEFSSTYQVTNSLPIAENFIFEAPPPIGYKLLQDYRVTKDNRRLEPRNQGEYQFPIQLTPGASTEFRVTYKAQGAPRWVYNANGRLLSKFRLTILANFANADFASGIIPTTMQPEGQGTRFTWNFADNVSVENPFGVFTATDRFKNTGILPRLLLLAPGVLLAWLLLLYLSIPMRWQDVVLASAVFFACLLSLTYASRSIDAKLAWGLLLPMLLLFGWRLGGNRQSRWSGIVLTFSGLVLPVFGLLVAYSGLTLGLSALISIGWLLFNQPRNAL